MSDVPASETADIRIMLARIEERQVAASKRAEERHESVTKKLENCVTKQEFSDLKRRTSDLESTQTWVTRGILGSLGAAILTAFLVVRQKVGI